ncbi:MAG: IS256 family transposase [Firmicutes bacterium]|nr:IS256 family transposase [Bacillota bacterium]
MKNQTTRNNATIDLAQSIIDQYHPKSGEDIQNALKDIFGSVMEGLLSAEMDNYLGYQSNDKGPKKTDNRRNGYGTKDLKTSYGNVTIKTPRDRDGSFEPQIVQKRQTDVSSIQDKVIALYARGMSQRDISSTIEDIYGFEVSHEMISNITDSIIPKANEWRIRTLKRCYAFLFVDCLYISIRTDQGASNYAVYVILGYDLEGKKDILGIWIGDECESKHYWMQVFDEIKQRGVEDVFFISMDGVSGLEDGAKSIFPNTIVQRCIVHLIRNSVKYVPTKDYKKFTSDIKSVYSAVNLETAQENFIKFCEKWSHYPGAVKVWENNFRFVEQLFDFGSSVRKTMYTTNAIESINSSYRKVTKKGSFPNESAVYKILYLRSIELEKKWNGSSVRDWSLVLNQLMMDERFSKRIEKYLQV